MKKLLLILLTAVLIGITSSVCSQQYNFIKYTNLNGLIDDQTTSLIQDKRGYLWIGTLQGLSKFDGNGFVNYNKFNGLSQNEIKDILLGTDNNLYVLHPNNKITKITPDYQFSILDELPPIKFAKNSSSSLDCEVNNGNQIKIYYDKNRNPLTISEENGLVENDIQDAIVDRENILWIATKENGLMGLPLQNFPIYTWNNTPLNHSYNQQDNTYLLSFTNHIVKTKIVEGKPQFSKLFTSSDKVINCAMMQNGGELLYGTNNGLYAYFTQSSTQYSFAELTGKKVTAIEKFGQRDLIIIANHRVFRYRSRYNETDLFPNLEEFRANSIVKLNGEVYILGKGNIYKLVGKEFVSIFGNIHQTKHLNFTHISKGLKGQKWISTSNFGLYQFNAQTNEFLNFSKKKNIPYTAVISCVQEENNLWISTRNGIVWYDIDKNAFSLFGGKYFKGVSFLPYTIKNNGHVFFITNKGVTKTFDSDVFENTSASLDITKALVSGKEVKPDSTFELNQSAFPIEFNYQSISLKDKIYYQYLLFGKDKKWSTPTLNTTVSYQYLEPGNYTFKVRTYDPINEIVLNENESSFIITVPYWKTPIFLFGIVMSLSGIIFLFYLIRTWRLKKQKEKLEKMVNEKTYTLTAQNQNIEQFSFSLSHDLKNPINNIKGLVEIMDDADEASRPEIKKMLLDSAKLLEEKIKATLETIKQMQANKKNVELLYFKDILDEVKSSLLIMISESKVKFNINFNKKSIHYNHSILESIFYNMISNSIKYGSDKRQKNISITTEKVDDKIVLIFEDNGIGFDTVKDMDKVFSIFERVHEQGEATGSGIGLYMIKQMIELNGGNIEVESKLDQGTKFIITLRKME